MHPHLHACIQFRRCTRTCWTKWQSYAAEFPSQLLQVERWWLPQLMSSSARKYPCVHIMAYFQNCSCMASETTLRVHSSPREGSGECCSKDGKGTPTSQHGCEPACEHIECTLGVPRMLFTLQPMLQCPCHECQIQHLS